MKPSEDEGQLKFEIALPEEVKEWLEQVESRPEKVSWWRETLEAWNPFDKDKW